jgi:hypothetical protein
MCRKYRCAWLDDDSIPDNLAPRITNSLIMKTSKDLRVFIGSDDSQHEADFIEYARSNSLRLIIHLLQHNTAKVVQEDGKIQILG